MFHDRRLRIVINTTFFALREKLSLSTTLVVIPVLFAILSLSTAVALEKGGAAAHH